MNATKKLLACGAFVAVTGGGLLMAADATADPPQPVVGAHQHWVLTGTGRYVPVGPNACENGQSIQFDNFHFNGHLGEPGSNGVIVGRLCGVDPNQ